MRTTFSSELHQRSGGAPRNGDMETAEHLQATRSNNCLDQPTEVRLRGVADQLHDVTGGHLPGPLVVVLCDVHQIAGGEWQPLDNVSVAELLGRSSFIAVVVVVRGDVRLNAAHEVIHGDK